MPKSSVGGPAGREETMLRLLGLLVVLSVSFGLGYYMGNHGVRDFQQAAADLSRDAFDRALGMGVNRDLQWQQELVDAKSSLVEAKSEMMERNYGSAGRELTKALDAVQAAGRVEADAGRSEAARRVASKIRDAKIRMTAGKSVPRSRLDEIEQDLDRLLAR